MYACLFIKWAFMLMMKTSILSEMLTFKFQTDWGKKFTHC